jgi:hypothetical protein
MPLNTNLLRAPAAIEFPDQFNRLAQFSQIQSAQNQNALAQYQLSAAQRAEEQQNAFYQQARQPNFKLDLSTALGFGKPGLEAFKAQREAENAGLTAKKTQSEIDAAELKRRSDIVENISGAFVPLAAASAQGTPVSLEQVQSAAQSLLRRGLIGKTEIDELPQSDADVPAFLKNLVLGSDKARKAFKESMPTIDRVDTGGGITSFQNNPLVSGYGQTMTNVPVIPKTAAPVGPTDLARLQTERAALIANNPKDPLINEYNKRIATLTTHQPASSTITNVNAYAPASVTAQQEFMKETRDTYGRLKDAPSVLDNIEKAKGLVKGAKGFMGPGGESLQQAASFLNNRLGTKIDTKGVSDAAELRSRLFFGIMDNLKKLDSQPTAQQQDALQAALGSLGTDPNALPRVLDAFGDTVRNRVERHNQEVTGAETRGVKFPYDPKITLPERAIPAAATAIPAAAIEALKSGKGNAKQFDEVFGAGAAARVLGGGK